ncbi:unnamed protein product, partial [Prorocentrum cordatum]
FKLHTAETVRGIQKRLHDVASQPDSKGEVEDLEALFGFNYEPSSILMDDHLAIDVPKVFSWDWMHVYFVGGVFTHELEACLDTLGSYGFGASTFAQILEQVEVAIGICRWKGRCPWEAQFSRRQRQ